MVSIIIASVVVGVVVLLIVVLVVVVVVVAGFVSDVAEFQPNVPAQVDHTAEEGHLA